MKYKYFNKEKTHEDSRSIWIIHIKCVLIQRTCNKLNKSKPVNKVYIPQGNIEETFWRIASIRVPYSWSDLLRQ